MKRTQIAAYFLVFCTLLVANPLLYSQGLTNPKDPIQQLLKPNLLKNQSAQYSAIFQGRGDGIDTCPVTGEKVSKKSLKAEYFGRTVYFCCLGCLKAAQRNPDKFIKPNAAEQQRAVKSYIAKAAHAPSGEEYCNE